MGQNTCFYTSKINIKMLYQTLSKALIFLVFTIIFVALTAGIIYFSIDLVQEKNNLMDIEEYSPTSSLVVEQNPKDRSKFPFVDVHSHQWKMPFVRYC